MGIFDFITVKRKGRPEDHGPIEIPTHRAESESPPETPCAADQTTEGTIESTAEAREDDSETRRQQARELYEKGSVYMQRNEDSEALNLFREAECLDPSNLLYRASRGRVLIKLKRWGEAREAFESVLEADPTDRSGLIGLGNVLAGTGNLGESIAFYLVVLARNQRDAGAWFCKALSEADLGRNADALASIDTCLGCDSPPRDAAAVRAAILARL